MLRRQHAGQAAQVGRVGGRRQHPTQVHLVDRARGDQVPDRLDTCQIRTFVKGRRPGAAFWTRPRRRWQWCWPDVGETRAGDVTLEADDDDPEPARVEPVEVVPDLGQPARETAVNVSEGLHDCRYGLGRSARPAATSSTTIAASLTVR